MRVWYVFICVEVEVQFASAPLAQGVQLDPMGQKEHARERKDSFIELYGTSGWAWPRS